MTRVCKAPGCSTHLSRFNTDNVCGPCEVKRRDSEDARLMRTHPKLPVPNPVRVRDRKPKLTEARFDAWFDREVAAMHREILNAPL